MHTSTYRVTQDIFASSGQRVSNYLIDLVIQYLLLFAIAFVAVILGNIFEVYAIGDYFASMDRIDEYLWGVLMIIVYYGIVESLLGRSLAKYITKTVVVLEDGSKPDAGTIMKRTFSRLIPFDAFSFLGEKTRGWHDTISDTYVVRKEMLDERMQLHYSFEEIGNPAL
ncbi:MAG TPA: RDD family protein [Flavobacterium sp.]|jgi:uncharacterized RDD family membrane protein YckC|nr:RDD family protein [Flavobacterium sp.]